MYETGLGKTVGFLVFWLSGLLPSSLYLTDLQERGIEVEEKKNWQHKA